MVSALDDAVTKAGGTVEYIAQKIGGVVTKDGKKIAAGQKIDGAPSVLYDAVAILATDEGAKGLAAMHPRGDLRSGASRTRQRTWGNVL